MRSVVHSRYCFIRTFTALLVLALLCLKENNSFAQSTSDSSDTLSGLVIDSATHEPIGRALVYSPDNRFATLTNSEGRFEFTFTKVNLNEGGSDRPYGLMARKPGYLPEIVAANMQNGDAKEIVLTLTPQAVIAGAVTLPTSEAPDKIELQLFRRQVHDGRGHWVQVQGSESMADGQFRFAGLSAGTYKLITGELLDTDPLVTGPRSDPYSVVGHGPLFGYPPVYYQNASDFASASTIQLSAGQTQTVNLSLVRQPYYRVRVPVTGPDVDQSGYGSIVTVYAGNKGPGFSLGYNPAHHTVEGMLPNGSYTVEVSNPRPNGATMSGLQTLVIKGAPIEGPPIALIPSSSVAVNVKEEFTSADQTGPMSFSISGRTSIVRGPRRYLNVTLEPADDFGAGHPATLRYPTGHGDEALLIDGVEPGKYWVQVHSSRGYAATIRSGNIDLQHQPLIVESGGTASPIEITMRDDFAEISGTVEGIASPAQGAVNAGVGQNNVQNIAQNIGQKFGQSSGQSSADVLFIPVADSTGQFADISVQRDGSFDLAALAPGTYRLMAFDRLQQDLEYRNPESLQALDSEGSVVRLSAGQKEHVTLQLIQTNASNSVQ